MPAGRKIREEAKVADVELLQAVNENITELGALLKRARQQRVPSNRISAQNRRILQNVFGMLEFSYNESDFYRFVRGEDFRFTAGYRTLPPLSPTATKRLERFIEEAGITLLDKNDIRRLANGEKFIIGGTLEKAPSGEEIKKLQRIFGIYIGVYEDGRVYIANKAGYLIQQLANNGIAVELLPSGEAVISNSLFVPSIPRDVLTRLEKGIAFAKEELRKGNAEAAIKIAGMIQNVISAYKFSEDFNDLAQLATPFIGIKLTKKEWEVLKKQFNEEEFRTITGASYAEFEQLGLSLGHLARWHAMESSEITNRIADAHVAALDLFISGAGEKDMETAEEECKKSMAMLELADINATRTTIILSTMPDILTARKKSGELKEVEIPEELRRERPDVVETVEFLQTSGIECLWGIESYSKYLTFYAAAGYIYENNEQKLEKIYALHEKAATGIQRLFELFNKDAVETINRTITEHTKAINFRKMVGDAHEKFMIVREALGEDSPLSDIEKDLLRNIFIVNAGGLTLADAERMLESLYERGMAPEEEMQEKFLKLANIIEFAYPFTWRLRMAKLDDEIKIKLSGRAPRRAALGRPGRPRSAADIVQEERRRRAMEMERPAVEADINRRRLAILRDADEAVKRLSLLLPPERKTEELAGKLGYALRNPTAELEDSLGALETRTGDKSRLGFAQLGMFTGEFTSLYNKGCEGVAKEIEERNFENAVSSLDWKREYLARTARFLDRHGETILWGSAAIGAIIGLFDSAGAGSAPQALGARMAVGTGMRLFSRRYGIQALRGAAGYLGLSGRVLALTSAATAGAAYLTMPKELSEEERKAEIGRIEYLLGKSIRFGVFGMLSSYPAGLGLLRVSPGLYGALGTANNSLIMGSAAFNLYNIFQATRAESRMPTPGETAMGFVDALYITLALVPGVRAANAIGGSFVRGMRGFREVGLPAALRGSYRTASLNLARIYGSATPAFQRGDVFLGGVLVAEPFVMHSLQETYDRNLEAAMTQEERELAEITPKRVGPAAIIGAGLPTAGVIEEVLPLAAYLERARLRRK